jgi:hypothetical protein
MNTRYTLPLVVATLVLVAPVLLAPGTRAQVVAGVTLTVCASGCDHTSIQAAIDAAPPGSLVFVGSGTYFESLYIDKALTLRGSGVGATIVNVSGQPGWGVATLASDVTLEDFTVSGTAGFYSLKIMGDVGNDPVGAGNGIPSTNVVLRDLEVLNSQGTGLDVNGVHGLTVEDVTVVNSDEGNGVTLTDVRNATLDGVTTVGNEWGGIAIYTSGKHYPIGVSNIDLVDVDVQEAKTLYVELDNFASPGSPAPATRLYVYRAEWPYYFHRRSGAAFDDRRHGALGRYTPADCVNVTTSGVSACTPAQAGVLGPDAPGVVAIEAVAPNPVTDAASVRFVLPDVGTARLALYDALGREVAVLAEGEYSEGAHTAALGAARLAPGLYVARLTSAYGAAVRRITVVR